MATHQAIAALVPQGAHVWDLGCGDGAFLLSRLSDGAHSLVGVVRVALFPAHPQLPAAGPVARSH
ncbi:MAG: methionine biosynthesis protein MetW [Burkholderiaceae bacterium]